MVKTCYDYIAGALTVEGHYSSDIRVFLSNTKKFVNSLALGVLWTG